MLKAIGTAELFHFLYKSLYFREKISFYLLDILSKTESKLLESAEEGRFYILKLLFLEDIDAVEFRVVEILHSVKTSFLCSDSEIFVVVADSDVEALVEEIVKACFNSLTELAEDQDRLVLHISADFTQEFQGILLLFNER